MLVFELQNTINFNFSHNSYYLNIQWPKNFHKLFQYFVNVVYNYFSSIANSTTKISVVGALLRHSYCLFSYSSIHNTWGSLGRHHSTACRSRVLPIHSCQTSEFCNHVSIHHYTNYRPNVSIVLYFTLIP